MKIRPLIIIFSLMMSPVAYADDVSIAFTTESQMVAPGAISEKITVQSQDASGNAQNIAETGDLFLTSNSATGEFSSSNATWKAVSQLTVSKNTANRSFYYKDSASGAYTLTAKLTLRNSGVSGSTSQNITIGTVTATSSNQNILAASTSDTTVTISDTVTRESDVNTISAHNSPLSTSGGIKTKPQLIVDAGRERVGVVDTPLAFSALAVDKEGKKVTGLSARWSFGDGTVAHGEVVQHVYPYPGDYVVIVNTQKSDLAAVDRTLVHILPSSLKIIRVMHGIMNNEVEIMNQGKTEVNLEGWSMAGGMRSYVFPSDTILLAGKRIILPYAVTKIMITDQDTISLLAPNQKTMDTYSLKDLYRPNMALSFTTATPTKEMITDIGTSSLSRMKSILVSLSKQVAPRVVGPYVKIAHPPRPIAKVVPPKREVVAVSSPSTIVIAKKSSKNNSGFFADLMSLFR